MSESQGQVPPGEGRSGDSPSRPGDYSAPGIGQDDAGLTPDLLGTPVEEGARPPAGVEAPQPPGAAQPVVMPDQSSAPEGAPPAYGAGAAVVPLAPPARKTGGARLWVTAIAAGLIGALIVLLALPAIFGVNPFDMVRGKLRNRTATEIIKVPAKNGTASPSQGATDVTAVAKQVTPCVVNIDIRTAAQPSPFSLGQAQEGTGSGVIYKSDGYIITNNHVVSDAQDITVTLASGTELKGKKVGADPETDIAVVKIDKADLPAIAVGNSDNLVVGQLVVAVGSPFGFEQTVTAGILSALHRVVASSDASGQQTTVLTDLIQTDAPINPGNSGGALCDGSANLIGINAVIASQSGGSEGIGFAIPINTAKQVADDLIAGRPVSHPYLGVLGQTVSPSIATRYNLPVSEGAYVTRVVPGSPADKAGIKNGDIIVGIDGKPIKSMDDVVAAVRSHAIGDKVSVTYYVGTSKKTASVTLQEKPTTLPQQ
ncbi:MAG: S1C family serine protease [Candidatus Geothermincolia bacterium]